MNTLDKLFSREIERRTGAHAINIYIDSNNKTKSRNRSLGSSALKANSNPPKSSRKTKKSSKKTTKVTIKHTEGSLFHRLNIRWPWLKLVAVIVVGVAMIVDFCDLTISRIGDPVSKVRIAPMAKHLKATNRIFEGKKLVALTFDDGPFPDTTPRLLDILHEKDVLATFFTLGSKATAYPDIIKRANQEFHEIASHTMYHQNLIRIPANSAISDINEAKTSIKSIIGHDPIYTRPPYGNTNDVVRTTVGTPIILWSVDTEDWKSKNVDAIIATAMSEVHDGAIILMHDIYPTTVDAVPILIDKLRENGYEFATLSELTKYRNIKLENGVSYYNFRP